MQCLVNKEHAVANVNRINRLISPPKDYNPLGAGLQEKGEPLLLEVVIKIGTALSAMTSVMIRSHVTIQEIRCDCVTSYYTEY